MRRMVVRNATRIELNEQQKPNDGSTHWSCRKLAKTLGISKDLVHRVWQEAGVKPHRLERHLPSNDPDFEKKAADIIGLYLIRRSTPLYFASTKRALFWRWIVLTRCCR